MTVALKITEKILDVDHPPLRKNLTPPLHSSDLLVTSDKALTKETGGIRQSVVELAFEDRI